MKFVILLALTLGACTPALQAGIEKAESTGDSVVKVGEDIVCNRLTVRAAKKRYWQTRERGEQWAKFCGYTPDSGLITPLLNK